jgi:hypothetical protein
VRAYVVHAFSPFQFGNGALSPFIPLWLGGEEYNEAPVVDLPSLQEVSVEKRVVGDDGVAVWRRVVGGL